MLLMGKAGINLLVPTLNPMFAVHWGASLGASSWPAEGQPSCEFPTKNDLNSFSYSK